MNLQTIINYIQTPEGVFALIMLILTVLGLFFGSRKIMKQKGGDHSSNVQTKNVITNNYVNDETRSR